MAAGLISYSQFKDTLQLAGLDLYFVITKFLLIGRENKLVKNSTGLSFCMIQ